MAARRGDPYLSAAYVQNLVAWHASGTLQRDMPKLPGAEKSLAALGEVAMRKFSPDTGVAYLDAVQGALATAATGKRGTAGAERNRLREVLANLGGGPAPLIRSAEGHLRTLEDRPSGPFLPGPVDAAFFRGHLLSGLSAVVAPNSLRSSTPLSTIFGRRLISCV